jgi:hypothetical protein
VDGWGRTARPQPGATRCSFALCLLGSPHRPEHESHRLPKARCADWALEAAVDSVDKTGALSEVTGNVVRHAYPDDGDGHIEIVVNEPARAVMIAVTGERGTNTELTSLGLDCQRCVP